jgi:sterol desaturase/sphingolipid hydroxylase (fatty acid hydroxylase superfamily)
MCKPTSKNQEVVSSAAPKVADALDNNNNNNNATANNANKIAQITPTHTKASRDTRYDWLYFIAPALFYKVTPVYAIYAIALTRLVCTHLILSLHYQFVDKDNYLNKISKRQLERERDDYTTAFFLHMWTQVALQLVFPNMFFSDASTIYDCAKETIFLHVALVEPLYYFVHRWLHVPQNMKSMHGFHHLSISTLPTTSLVQNFHEHIVYICTFGPAFLLPFLVQGRQHWIVIGGYLIAFDVLNAYGHTNIRVRHWLFTSRYSPLTYLFYTPEFHLGHHKYFNANYTLFMPIWDMLMGTYREYQKKDLEQLLPREQQDFVFIGHNGGLGHLMTVPELCIYNVYNDYPRTFLPVKLEFFIMHLIASVYRMLVSTFYTCSRFCIANEYIGRIIVLARTPWDYMNPQSYSVINQEILKCMRNEHKKCGTRKFGLGNLNKMKQLNDGGLDIARLVAQDAYLKDKNIRVWTGDTMTVASVYHQIADIDHLDAFFYVGAGGKVGTAVCHLLTQNRPHLKIRIFSKNHVLNHPNISYSNDLSEMAHYKVVLLGKLLSAQMYNKALQSQVSVQTRFVLDYTVPAFPIAALQERPEHIQHIRVGVLKTFPNNPFLKGHYDFCMSHDENMIVPCHFGCLLNTINGRDTDEVGDVDPQDVEKLWQMTLARGFQNISIDYNAVE